MYILIACCLVISACSPAVQQTDEVLPSASQTDTPAEMVLQPNPEKQMLELPALQPESVALDFAARPCSASWSNSGEYLPCPGNLDEITEGYADSVKSFRISGEIQVDEPALLTIPAQTASSFGGIFGKYSPFTIQPGDRFKALLACMDGYPLCDVTFSLEYYTSLNAVEKVPGAEWKVSVDSQGGYITADASLELLAGRTMQLLLVVRDNGDPRDDYALWIQPYIWRSPQKSAPAHQEHIPIIEEVNVSGTVDMSTAPPYLFDDHPPGSPVTVVLSNVGAPQIFWTTTVSSHPNFSLDVVPGSYYVHAYAPGVGDVPYVTGAFTGLHPSCGQPLQYIIALSGKPVSGVVINDWNWSCGGTAERFEKPADVPLP